MAKDRKLEAYGLTVIDVGPGLVLDVLKEIKMKPCIRFAYAVTGDHDIIAFLQASHRKELGEVLHGENGIRAIRGVRKTLTHFIYYEPDIVEGYRDRRHKAFAFISLIPSAGDAFRVVKHIREKAPDKELVPELYIVTGEADVIAVLNVDDIEDIGRLMLDVIHEAPGVIATKTYIALPES